MKITGFGRWLAICGVVAAGASVSACNTTKATLDTTVAFFSSTSPQDIFSADGLVRQEQKINLFAGVAYENLRQEAAAGGGQYVTSLATLYGVPEAGHADFARLLQQHHADLFVTGLQEDKTAHLQMVKALNRVLLADASSGK
ncbi:MAG TPA: DUF3015 family protein [Nitrospiraceae bacterium]|jgi:hypothetical protein|nr:DUF3015 family protein [Nitrospiraceae bacterium]